MHLNRLCYILPADSDIGDEISSKKNPAGALHLNRLTYVLPAKSEHRQEKSSRNCNDQIVALLNRIVKPLNFCSGIRKKRGRPGRFSGAFHDAPGMRLSRRNNGDNNHANNNSPRIFSFAELYIGSNGFSQKELLGSGGFGRVYKAALPSDGSLVAVKCLAEKGEHIEKTFAAELVAVAHLRHRNLVRLRGWCVHEDQLLLVYDYMPNRSLDRLIFAPSTTNQKNRDTTLDWERRKKIIRGLAAALYYLHEQLDTQIIHRDVKSSNVMLDSHFNARLGDFGLARWLEHDLNSTSVLDHQFRLAETTRIGGTIGYLPPESFQRKYIATAKSDVFSFGIVALELASGRRAVDLAYPDDHIVLLDSVRRSADEGSLLQAADSRLLDGSYSLSEMEILIHLGLLCTLHDPKSRPNMRWIVEMLSGNVIGKLPSLPSFKSQPRYISISGSTTSRSKITTSSSSDKPPTPSIFITATTDTLFLTAEPESTTTEKSGMMKGSSAGSRRHQFNPIPTVETPREISYNEIVVATNNFSDEHRVAEVDFGTAYHGTLENRHHVIVKRLTMKTCPALRARFSTELQNIGRLRHRNLVQLRGWCTEHGEMLVVYDYMATRLLSHILFHNNHTCLTWRQRYNIIKSLASAILYLHEEWDEQVIHRHITSASIALDLDTNPRLTSFALAEFLTRNEHGHHVEKDSTKSVRGIFGYMSPEYMESGEANTAADIYSFGVVVVEVVTGQMAVDFRRPEVLLVKRLHEFELKKREMEELVDQRLDGEYDRFEFSRLVKLGLACTRSKPEERPSIRQIMSILDGNDSGFIQGKKEKGDEWRQRNAAALALTRRIQALGIQ
ncbi:uncharacterized protein [Phyllobates terribilis]|uniref:uncharacterized protein n=1 Tax=Phyllobates terribilis TaxID=111132 RepID=UPI003CCAC06D